jgi:signal transduction histidine kinase
MPTKRWYRDWLGWVIVGSVAYGIICLISLTVDIGRPFPGFITYYNPIHTRMEVEWNTPSWWWDTTGERPLINDILIQVDETPFNGVLQPVEETLLYQTAWDQGKTTVDVTVDRDGALITFPVSLELFSWAHYGDLMLLSVILATCYWLLAIILYRASGGESKQRLVVLILCAFAIIGLALQGSLFIFGGWRENILSFINPLHSLTVTLFGALMIHLAFRFPYPRWPRLSRALLPFTYLLAVILFFFFFLAKVTVWHTGATPLARWMDLAWLNGFQYLIIISIVFLLARMLGEAVLLPGKSRYREEARIMLLALFLFLPTVWFALHGVSGTNTTILFLQSLADTRYLALVVPFAFAAISLRYHTFAGDKSWLFLALMLAVSGFLANAGVALLFWQAPNMIRELPFPPTAVLFVLFLFISLIWGWQSSWRGWLGRLFNWDRINYRAVQKFGHALAAQPYSDRSQLAQNIVTTLCHELSLECAACWLTEGDTMQLSATDGRLQIKAPQVLHPPTGLIDRPIRLEEPKPDWLQSMMSEITVILPLFISGKLLGVLAVGQRWDAAIFDGRDLEILTLISQQAALMLHNTQQTAQLRQTDQQLLRIQELTRQKTAQNLHDHVLPTLSFVQMQLLTADQLINTQPDKAHTILAESQESLRKNSDLVRRIQKDLVIRSLEFGLSPYLRELVNQFNHDMGVTTNLQLPPSLDTIITNTSTRETIYAVWQQALDNIYQHAQATQVTINVELDFDQLTFTICDNGRGSQPIQRQEALQNGHFGLRSMQIRLQSIGGQFAFQSALDQGSCVQGQIPLPDTKSP